MRERAHERELKPAGLRGVTLWVWFIVLLLALPHSVRAQDEQPSTSNQDSSSTPAASTSADTDSEPDPLANQTTVSTLDTGQSIDHATTSAYRTSALQWGHLSLLSADVFNAFDSNYKFAPTNPRASDALAARLLALYSIGSEHTALDIQYRPFVLISENDREADLAAGQLNLHMYRRLGARWLFTFLEVFSYLPDRGRFIDATTTTNFSTGQVAQEAFLANGSKELRNNTTPSLAYRLTRHDTIILHGQYEFVNLTSQFKLPNTVPSGFETTNTVGGGVSWTHALSTYHEFGVSYYFDREYLGGFSGGSRFQSVLFTYGQWFGPGLRLHVEVGPSLQIHEDGNPSYTTVRASVEVFKTFHESRLAVLYSRDYSYTGVITDSYHNRFDVYYSRKFSPLWELTAGGGYETNNSSTVSSEIGGRDLWIHVDHRLSPGWGLLASFANSASYGGSRPYASRNFLTVGLHWSGQRE